MATGSGRSERVQSVPLRVAIVTVVGTGTARLKICNFDVAKRAIHEKQRMLYLWRCRAVSMGPEPGAPVRPPGFLICRILFWEGIAERGKDTESGTRHPASDRWRGASLASLNSGGLLCRLDNLARIEQTSSFCEQTKPFLTR